MEFILYNATKFSNSVEALNEDDRPRLCRSQIQALDAFRAGSSLRIAGIQRFSLQITSLCDNLEQLINSPINVNMYLTPGSGKKALKRHYDTHDVFVLQIHGDKLWRLYDQPFLAPLEYLPFQRNERMRDLKFNRLRNDHTGRDKCQLTDSFTLSPGDCLYLPRGFWHEAESRPDEVSCHLTVGVQPTTYLDVLSVAVSQAALSDVRLRQPLPFGFATNADAPSVIAEHLARVVLDIPSNLNVPAALGHVSAHFLRKSTAGFENNLLRFGAATPATQLTVDDPVRLRLGMVCGVNATASPVQMIFGTKAFEIDPIYIPACLYIGRNLHFCPRDLLGSLTPEQQIALVSQLISEGLLIKSSTLNDDVHHWIPIRADAESATLQWLDFGKYPIREPFLHQSVRYLKKEYPQANTKVTKLASLRKIEEDLSPSGFVFHISRCGSTLLSNALRALPGTVVISEPQPIGAVLSLATLSPTPEMDAIRQEGFLDEMLKGLIRAYGQRRTGSENSLVIKFSSWNILHIAKIRKLWPLVPCAIVVRDPAEVAVSCLDAATGWMRWKAKPDTAPGFLGFGIEELKTMSEETFCARMIGTFLRCAAVEKDDRCVVVDYSSLNQASVESIADFFNIGVTDEGREAIQKSLSLYSKDAQGKRIFSDDREFKRSRVTDALRAEIDEWAKLAYESLG